MQEERSRAEAEDDFDRQKGMDERVSATAVTLDVPEAIAELCAKISDSSSQSHFEDHRFETMLKRVITPDRPLMKKRKSDSPLKSTASSPHLGDHLELLERSLNQSRQEDDQFELKLKRALMQDRSWFFSILYLCEFLY